MAKTVAVSESFSIESAFKDGWELFKSKFAFLLGLGAVVFLSSVAIQYVETMLTDSMTPILALVVMAVAYVINTIISMGALYLIIQVARRKEVSYADVFTPANSVVQYVFATLLVGIIVVIGLILLIVPGILWAIKYTFVPYLVVDKGMTALQAMEASDKMTKDDKMSIFLFWIVSMIINVLGMIPLGLGLIITIPVSMLAYARMYDSMLAKLK
jgi:uncharacterized membrane protein